MIIGFTFNKIDVERHAPVKGKVQISNDVAIQEVSERAFPLHDKQKAMNFQFVFTVDYKPDIGHITIHGEVLYLAEEKLCKEVLSSWKAKKKIPKEVSVVLLNAVLGKCNIKALELSQDLNLPPHIPLPKVNFAKQTLADSYIG